MCMQYHINIREKYIFLTRYIENYQFLFYIKIIIIYIEYINNENKNYQFLFYIKVIIIYIAYVYIYNENKTMNLFFYIKVIMIYMAYINNENKFTFLPTFH